MTDGGMQAGLHTNVGWRRRQIGCRHVPISQARIIASVERPHASNLHHEHGCTQHVASPPRCNLSSPDDHFVSQQAQII